DVAAATLDLRRDRPEDASATCDELSDRGRVDEGRVAGPGLAEVEHPRSRRSENRLHERTHRAGDSLGTLAPSHRARDLAAKVAERRAPRQAASPHGLLIRADAQRAE